MRIERIELRQVYLPYVSPFETSGWRQEGTHSIIVRVDADGMTGWGESPVDEAPFYNEENFATAWRIQQQLVNLAARRDFLLHGLP